MPGGDDHGIGAPVSLQPLAHRFADEAPHRDIVAADMGDRAAAHGPVDGDDRNPGGFRGLYRRDHGVRVHGIDDQDVDAPGDQVLDVVVLAVHVAVGVEEDQRVRLRLGSGRRSLHQLDIERRLQGDLAEAEGQPFGARGRGKQGSHSDGGRGQ